MTTQITPDATPASMDIFRRDSDGSFIWVATAENLALARQNVVSNPASSDFAFLIVNLTTGEKTLIEPSERPPDGSVVVG